MIHTNHTTRRWSVTTIATYVLLWGYAAIVLIPLLLVISNALRPTREIFKNPIGLPTSPTLNSLSKPGRKQVSTRTFLTLCSLLSPLCC